MINNCKHTLTACSSAMAQADSRAGSLQQRRPAMAEQAFVMSSNLGERGVSLKILPEEEGLFSVHQIRVHRPHFT